MDNQSPSRRVSARALIVAAMLAAGALAAPALAPALAQKAPPAAGPSVNGKMVKPLNEGIVAVNAQNWPEAKAKLDAAYAAAKTPQEKLIVEQQRYRLADGQKDAAGKVAAIQAALATGALVGEAAKPYKGSLAAAYAEAGDNVKAVAATKAYIDEYGGTAAQYGSLASDARKAGDFATSETYIQKAIDAAKAENGSAADIEKYQSFQAHTFWDAKDDAKYTAAMAALITAYPAKDDYWRELIARAQGEPGYQAAAKDIQLDLYRTMMATPIKMLSSEKSTVAGIAITQNLPNEALNILKPLIASGELGGASDARAEVNKKNLADAERKTKLEDAGLAKEEKDSAAKGDTTYMAQVGEVLMTHGEYARAAALLKAALDKGVADADKADIVRLHLGMSQYKAGDKAAAKATFASIKTTNGAVGLARTWSVIIDKG